MEEKKREYIDLSELIARERIRTVERLKARIEELQDRIVRGFEREGWGRLTSYNRELVTSLGAIELTIQEVKRGGRVTSPLIDALGMRRKRYSQELRMILADMAARLSLIRGHKEAVPEDNRHRCSEADNTLVRAGDRSQARGCV